MLSKEIALGLYRRMLLLREFEDKVSIIYRQGEIPGFVHLYQGEEAVAAGVCIHLRQEDFIASTHRGHGHVLAKGGSAKETMAELYARETGLSGGRGGSMHMYSKAHGLLGTNGIVGGGIPMALGAGLTCKNKKNGYVAVTFFGDGASNMGILYESLNLASKLKLPVVFVCENNLFATATPLERVAANVEIATRAAAFCLPGVAVDGNDVVRVYQAAMTAIERARKGEGPTLIEAKTYRQHGHHEGDALYGTYRTQEQVEYWRQKRDPIRLFETVLKADYSIDDSQLSALREATVVEVEEAIAFSRKSPFPERETALRHVFEG